MKASPATSFKKIIPRTRRVRLPERRGGGVSETGVVAGGGTDTDEGNNGWPLGYAAAGGPIATGKLKNISHRALPFQYSSKTLTMTLSSGTFWKPLLSVSRYSV